MEVSVPSARTSSEGGGRRKGERVGGEGMERKKTCRVSIVRGTIAMSSSAFDGSARK